MSEVGHNSGGQLKAIMDRLERLETDKRALADDIRDVYAEAKGNGYDPAALREILKVIMEDADKRRKREEREAIVDTYKVNLGIA